MNLATQVKNESIVIREATLKDIVGRINGMEFLGSYNGQSLVCESSTGILYLEQSGPTYSQMGMNQRELEKPSKVYDLSHLF